MNRGSFSERDRSIMRETLADMPRLRREVYLLSARDEADYSEIARRLDITVRQVERHLAEALVDLMRALDDGDGEPAPSLQ